MSVSLTGGEALTRKDFWEILDALIEHGIVITQIYSNGALVNENVLKELDKRKIHPSFIMSFDGVDGWHDWLRGVTGAQKLIDRAFELCRDMGFAASASMTIHQGNKHTLRATINHLASLGVQSFKTGYAANLGEWKTHNNQSVGLKDIFQAYLDYLPYYYEDGMPMNIEFTSFFRASKNNPDKYGIVCYKEEYNPLKNILCSAIRNYAYISPDGRVLPCTVYDGFDIRENYPALFEKSFSECVSAPDFVNLVKMTTSELHEANVKCRTCKFNKHCDGGCRPSLLYLGEKDLMSENKIQCALYYGGWVKKIVDAVKKARPSAESPVKDLAMLQ